MVPSHLASRRFFPRPCCIAPTDPAPAWLSAAPEMVGAFSPLVGGGLPRMAKALGTRCNPQLPLRARTAGIRDDGRRRIRAFGPLGRGAGAARSCAGNLGQARI